MRKKRLICGVLAGTMILGVTLSGCSQISSDTFADMEQEIATVNISGAENFDEELLPYKDAVGTTSIIKRELISYFITSGNSMLGSTNGNYATIFNNLMESLVNNAVLVQYSTMYLLKEQTVQGSTAAEVVQAYLDSGNDAESDVKKKVKRYEYLLGEDSEEVMVAKYNLMSTWNSRLDSYEKRILENDDSAEGTETRTTPVNTDKEREDYYPEKDGAIDYNVFTGFMGYRIENSGIYEDNRLEGSGTATRIRAYNDYISELVAAKLVDATRENLRDVKTLDYYNEEYVLRLEERIINKYIELYETEREEGLLKGDTGFLQDTYDDILDNQTDSFKASGFNTNMGSMSDSSFILYAPDTDGEEGTYGFVYNILLPFSAAQSASLTNLQSVYSDSDETSGYSAGYYKERNNLLMQIKTTDQRSAWFNGQTEYAFKAGADDVYYGKSASKDGWLFFENNFKKTYRYEELKNYAGMYPYNGTVVEKEDGYVLIENELTINQMLDEFSAYIDFVLDPTGAEKGNVTVNYTANYEDTEEFYQKDGDDYVLDKDGKKQLDYSKFVYASGKIELGETDANALRGNVFNKETKQNKVLGAVNELQFAYTTDTSVLSQYVGYSVSVGETSYIKEFEYAAQQAVAQGAGAFSVCAGDYGWHLIYVTYTFTPESEQYSPDWTKVTVEGTFENLFYEWVKTSNIANISTNRRTQIITRYNVEKTVTKYVDRYQDLLDMQ